MSRRKGVSNGLVAILIIIVAFIAGLYAYNTLYAPQLSTEKPSQPATPTGYTARITINEVNSLTHASVSAGSSYTIYHSEGKSLAGLSTLYGTDLDYSSYSGSYVDFRVTPSDHDRVFIAISPASGYFVDPDKLSKKLGVTNLKWMPVSSPVTEIPVVEVNLLEWGSPNLQVTPSLTATLSVPYFVDGTSSVSITGPSDVTSASGTSQALTWTLSGNDANTAFAISQITITSNQTSPVLTFTQLTIGDNQPVYNGPPGGVFKSISPVGYTGSVPTSWVVYQGQPANQLSSAILIPNPSGSAGDTRLTLGVQVGSFTGAISITLTVTLINSAGSTTTLTDTVVLSA